MRRKKKGEKSSEQRKPVRVLKNVRLKKVREHGYDNWKLYHIYADGSESEDPYFGYFTEHLLPGEGSGSDARNTRYNYTHQAAGFLDFMTEAVNYLNKHGNTEMNGVILARLINKYPKFLAEADESGDELVAAVAKSLNATPCRRSTQSIYIGAVNKYLNLSEDFNVIMRELGIHDIYGTPLYSEADLFPEAVGRVALSTKERIALTRNSMLAGVVSGGARLKSIAKLKTMKPVVKKDVAQGSDLEEFYQNDHFPFEHTARLIYEGFSSLRDKALFCLLMACGCRLHEALLLTWDDIDTRRQLVRLRCPHDKSLKDFKGFFRNISEINDLPWKGRLTSRTALIEPFRTHFWILLNEYQKSKEFTLTNSHNFIFQIIMRENKGAPLVMSDFRNIRASMEIACEKIGIKPRGPHSLRHMYGFYCLNFLPFDDGTFGMSLRDVQDLIGHADIKSTQRYAIPDTQLNMMRQKVTFAVIRDFSVNTGREVRLEMMKKEYEKLHEEITQEKLLLEQSSGND